MNLITELIEIDKKKTNNILEIIKKLDLNNENIIEEIIKKWIPEEGSLYCLYNEMFNYYGDNIYKLGCSKNPETRLCGYTTSFIKPCEYKIISKKYIDCRLAENLLFKNITENRIEQNREFFKMDILEIKKEFKKIEIFFENKTKEEIVKYFIEEYKENNKTKIFKESRINKVKNELLQRLINEENKIQKSDKILYKKISKKEIKDNILELFKIKETELNEFQTNLLSSDILIEKHFNLRAYIKNTIDKKIDRNVYKSLFTETVNRRYVKIKLCKKFMEELGFNKLEDIINEKNEIRLCQECSLSINNPIILEKKKRIRWCNELCEKMINNNDVNENLKKIYKQIKEGDIIICKKCQPILIEKELSNDILYKIPVILNKMNTIVKSEWINANLINIKNMFDIRGEYKDKNYYTLYLLMATIIKQLFGSDILICERILIKNDRYIIYNLNNQVINEHNILMNILDNNKFKYDISLLDFDDVDDDENNDE